MAPDGDRWEQGSEFHWLGAGEPVEGAQAHPWSEQSVLFGSGRDALRALVRSGLAKSGWKRVLVPSYLCQEVVAALASEGLEIRVYFDDPREAIRAPCPGPGEALLVVNTFGVRSRWWPPACRAGCIIEDHTHDPWSDWARTSGADYCVASLRKTLPVPDGGVIWSPTGRELPPSPRLTEAHAVAANQKLEAMLLKAIFLNGHSIDKGSFRSLATSGETGIATAEISAISPVSSAVVNCLDTMWWRRRRRENFELLAEGLRDQSGVKVVPPQALGSCPFSCVLLCADESTRGRLREGLIERRIYPAVLWPLEESMLDLPEESIGLSRRMLSIHCDGRYGPADMMRVADAILESLP